MRLLFLLLVVAPAGCTRPVALPATPVLAQPSPNRFDPATSGAVRGRVVWVGERPTVPVIPAAIPDGTGFRLGSKPNPFAPAITDGVLAGVVVSLVGDGLGATKPWPFPLVTVEQADHELRVKQGDSTAAAGIARVGDAVTVVSRDPGPATVRLRGAAFVTLPFPGPDKPTTRTFDKPGVVEVSSGTMLTWAACDLIVSDHPYHSVTGADGRFELTGVPPGEYQLTCRVRDWREVGRDRDPETGLIARRRFAPPVELSATVRVPERGAVEHTFTIEPTLFVRSPKR